MQSPVYDRECDLAAITPDGRVAGFAMFWPDNALSLAQFEPVGVDPDFQRLGIARALIATGLEPGRSRYPAGARDDERIERGRDRLLSRVWVRSR